MTITHAEMMNGAEMLPAPIDGGAALALYDTACKALAEAKAVDEVQNIRATAEAMRAYAKQAGNKQLELDAAEIRIRAERQLGLLMKAQGETVGKATGQLRRGLESNPREMDDPPTLAEAGIDKNLAHRARTLAAMPEPKFEKALADKRKRGSVRVVLDPEFEAEAEAAARDLELDRDERIALSGGGELAAENEQLRKQITGLDRRIATLGNDLAAANKRATMWQERAIAAGWRKAGADA